MSSSRWTPIKKRKSSPTTSNICSVFSLAKEQASNATLGQSQSEFVASSEDIQTDFLSFVSKLSMTLQDLTEYFICPICLDFVSNAHVAPECFHHFCKDCIRESLTRCKNQCPTCRSTISTYRSLRQDKSFGQIVQQVQNLSTLIDEKLKELQEQSKRMMKINDTSTSKKCSSNDEKKLQTNPISTVNNGMNDSAPSQCSAHDDSDSSVCFVGTQQMPIAQRRQNINMSKLRSFTRSASNRVSANHLTIDVDSDSEDSSNDEIWVTTKAPITNGGRGVPRQHNTTNKEKKDDDSLSESNESCSSISVSNIKKNNNASQPKKRRAGGSKVSAGEAQQREKIKQGAIAYLAKDPAGTSSSEKSHPADYDSNGIINKSPNRLSSYAATSRGKNTHYSSDDDSDSNAFEDIIKLSNFRHTKDRENTRIAYKDETNFDKTDCDEEHKVAISQTTAHYKSDDILYENTEETHGGCKSEEQETFPRNKRHNGNSCIKHNHTRPARNRHETQRYGYMLSDHQVDAYLSQWK